MIAIEGWKKCLWRSLLADHVCTSVIVCAVGKTLASLPFYPFDFTKQGTSYQYISYTIYQSDTLNID